MQKFEINKSGIDDIKRLIEKQSDEHLRIRLENLHYADIAEVIYELSADQSTYLVKPWIVKKLPMPLLKLMKTLGKES